MGLQEADHKGYGVSACEALCAATPACSVIAIHESDKHCHTYAGNVTHAQFAAELEKSALYQSCYWDRGAVRNGRASLSYRFS